MLQTDWISVKDRLPDREGRYLIHAPSADPDLPYVAIAWYHADSRTWTLLPSMWIRAMTHWMPPVPPPGGEPSPRVPDQRTPRAADTDRQIVALKAAIAEVRCDLEQAKLDHHQLVCHASMSVAEMPFARRRIAGLEAVLRHLLRALEPHHRDRPDLAEAVARARAFLASEPLDFQR